LAARFPMVRVFWEKLLKGPRSRRDDALTAL
jgi:hypothetical protein